MVCSKLSPLMCILTCRTSAPPPFPSQFHRIIGYSFANAVDLPQVRRARHPSVAISHTPGIPEELDRRFSYSMPGLPPSLANQRLVERVLEVRALPAMWPADPCHLEPTPLPPCAVDGLVAAA